MSGLPEAFPLLVTVCDFGIFEFGSSATALEILRVGTFWLFSAFAAM